MAVTAKDVAEACGVSRITVNRALSGNENVKPETREKILKKGTGKWDTFQILSHEVL